MSLTASADAGGPSDSPAWRLLVSAATPTVDPIQANPTTARIAIGSALVPTPTPLPSASPGLKSRRSGARPSLGLKSRRSGARPSPRLSDAQSRTRLLERGPNRQDVALHRA